MPSVVRAGLLQAARKLFLDSALGRELQAQVKPAFRFANPSVFKDLARNRPFQSLSRTGEALNARGDGNTASTSRLLASTPSRSRHALGVAYVAGTSKSVSDSWLRPTFE
jgi:hypothetical protein